MKTLMYLTVSCLIAVLSYHQAGAKDGDGEGLRVVIGLGPSIPSESFADVYGLVGSDRQNLWQAYEASATLGIHATGRLRFGLSENLSIVALAAYHRFADVEQIATLEDGRRLPLSSVVNIVPIGAGFQYFLFRTVVSPYVVGDVSVTTTRVTVNQAPKSFTDLLQTEGVELAPSTTRLGGSVGFGIELPLKVIDPFIEFRYTSANMVGRNDGEVLRTFYTLTIGVTL
jgi:hypothetical protein